MNEKNEIVSEFSRYCSKCEGVCCKRGVFTVFGWEMEKLSREHKELLDADVFDQRGSCKDIAMHGLCMFSTGNGCKLTMEMRPTDCITFPFYPKLKEKEDKMEIESILIQNECPFSMEISKNEILLKYIRDYWNVLIEKNTRQEIIDWIGRDGFWQSWYNNAIEVK